MKERIEFIDTAKMMGICLMIIGHCNMINCVPYLGKFIYLFHMPLFFIISGYLFKPIEIKKSIKKYSVAYLLPYVTMAVATLVVVVPSSIYLNINVGKEVKNLLLAIFMGSGNFGGDFPAIGVGWFLCALFISIFVYNALSKYNSYTNKSIIVIILFALSWLSCQKLTIPFSVQAGLSSMLFLLVGEGLKKSKILENNVTISKPVIPLVVVIVLFAVIYGNLSVSRCVYEMPIITLPACISLCFCVFLLSKKIKMGGGNIHCQSWQVIN